MCMCKNSYMVSIFIGEVASNSLFLEELGWSGLLVECNPLLLPKLMKKNRKAWIAPVCLSTTNTSKLVNNFIPKYMNICGHLVFGTNLLLYLLDEL